MINLGFLQESQCELAHLSFKNTSMNKDFLKNIFTYISGDWLALLKNINKQNKGEVLAHLDITRFMSFPKKYNELIEKYSNKAKVDKFLVYALIRQESVYNNKALSVAGAKGLMQLMSRTARSEAKILPKSYLPRKDQKNLVRSIRLSRIYIMLIIILLLESII